MAAMMNENNEQEKEIQTFAAEEEVETIAAEEEVVTVAEEEDGELQSAGKKRKGARGPGWTKSNEFITDNYARSKRNFRKVDSFIRLLDEWYENTHTPAVFMAFCNGGIKYHGNTEAMDMFCREDVVKESFTNALRKCHRNKSETYNEFTISENWNNYNTKEKRRLVKELVQFQTKLQRVMWTDRHKPVWWPEAIVFRNPTGGKPFSKDECESVINTFIENGRACFFLDGTEEPLETEPEIVPTYSDAAILCSSNFSSTVTDDLCCRFQEIENKLEVLKACQVEMEKLQENAFNNHLVKFEDIDLQYRCHGEDNMEPVMVGADGNCLYRAVSKCLFGVEEKWGMLKLGCLVMGEVEMDDILAKMKSEFGENLRDFVEGECPPDGSFKSLLEERIPISAKRGAYSGIIEIIYLSRFANVEIDLKLLPKFDNFQHFNRKYVFSEVVWGKCKLLCSGRSNPNHFFPLMPCSEIIQGNVIGNQCWARWCCKVKFGDSVVCENCNLQYHKACISFTASEDDSCGCDNLDIASSFYWLSDVNEVEENFQRINTAELKVHLDKILHQGIKSFRLNDLFRKLLSRTLKRKEFDWFKTLDTAILSKIKHFLPELDFRSFSKRDQDLLLLLDDVIVPEVIIYITSTLNNVTILSLERWISSQTFS